MEDAAFNPEGVCLHSVRIYTTPASLSSTDKISTWSFHGGNFLRFRRRVKRKEEE